MFGQEFEDVMTMNQHSAEGSGSQSEVYLMIPLDWVVLLGERTVGSIL